MTMAPGILPAATSALMKSSMRDSFSTDRLAPGGGPSWTAAAVQAYASEAAMRIAASSAFGLHGDIDHPALSFNEPYCSAARQSRWLAVAGVNHIQEYGLISFCCSEE